MSIRSAGPLSASPPMIGLTATTGIPARARAATRPPTGPAMIGPIETNGFDGPMTITSAASIAATTSAVAAPSRSRRTGPRARPAPAGDGRSTPGTRASPRRSGPGSAPASSVIGRIGVAIAERGLDRAHGLGQPPALAQPRGPGDMGGEVPVAEPEPVLLAQFGECRPSRSRSRRRCPSRARRRTGPTACTASRRDRASPAARAARCRRRC